MKCKSCGHEVTKEAIVCENCGFDLGEFRKLKKVIVEEDPDVDPTKKSSLIDSPILAFVFGILSILSSLTFVVYWSFKVDWILLPIIFVFVVLFNFLTFKLASKPTKVSLKPFCVVGRGMAYFSIGYIILKIVFELLKPLF